MSKTLVIVLVMLPGWLFSRRDRHPPTGIIDHAYFYCEQCDSLVGGIFGKGPVKHFDGPNKRRCVHAWRKITKAEFKALAGKLYAVDWASEHDWWWCRDGDPVKAKAALEQLGGRFQEEAKQRGKTVVAIDLNGKPVTDADMHRLEEFDQTRELDLGGTRITDSGLKHLGGLSKLESLSLRGTGISDAGVEQLEKSNVVKRLHTLDLTGTQCTDGGVQRLQQAWPNLQIIRSP
jgi:hypothetical protein